MKRLIAVALIVTMTGCATESQQAKTESTGTGTAIGAIVGAVIGSLAGGKRGAAIGAATGALIGGVAGYSYGDKIAQRHQELQGKENDLNARMNFARGVNQDTEEYNQKLRQEIASTRQEVDDLAVQVKRQQVNQQQLQATRQQLNAKVSNAQQQLSIAQTELNNLKVFRSQQPRQSTELDAEISRLQTNVDQLKSNTIALGVSVKAIALVVSVKEQELQQLEHSNLEGLSMGLESLGDNLPSQAIRSFPWPPPLASAIETIPFGLLQEKSRPVRLIDTAHRLTDAIRQNGYYESSYYAVPKGFALATRMEQIEPDGAPKKQPQRWALKDQPLAEFSLAAYLKALLFASPGYYRVIVFIVTSVPFTQSPSAPTMEEAKKWLSLGYDRLPDDIGKSEFSPAYTCTALIYEFERASESDEPRFRQPGRISGHDHLVKAGIWASLQP